MSGLGSEPLLRIISTSHLRRKSRKSRKSATNDEPSLICTGALVIAIRWLEFVGARSPSYSLGKYSSRKYRIATFTIALCARSPVPVSTTNARVDPDAFAAHR